MWNFIKNELAQYLSIEESRKSIIVITFVGLVAMGLYKTYSGNDIPPNLNSTIVTLTGIIFGANISNTMSNIYSTYMSNKITGKNNIDGGV